MKNKSSGKVEKRRMPCDDFDFQVCGQNAGSYLKTGHRHLSLTIRNAQLISAADAVYKYA
jgi:hypothetical protein